MGNIRKKSKSWTAQVRVSGWQSFTKTFDTKSSAQEWIKHTEHALKMQWFCLIIAFNR